MLTVAIAQFNPTVGDLAGNRARIAERARQAHAEGAHLLLTPELALCGYPPEDLLLRPGFMQDCEEQLALLQAELSDLPNFAAVVGHPHRFNACGDRRTRSTQEPLRYNAASVLSGGRCLATVLKRELPNYQVFDERRYFADGRFAPGAPGNTVDFMGLRIGLLICEDAWFDEPADLAAAAGAQLLCVLNASPFHGDKQHEREARMSAHAVRLQLPVVYAHLVGGQDELVFDGYSFVVDATGAVQARAPGFQECLLRVPFQQQPSGPMQPVPQTLAPIGSLEEQVWAALVLGVRDYIGKNGFPGVLIGLSGGVDSALVLAIAVDALGADRVRAVMMPSPYTADISWIDAREMANRLGVRYDEISIAPLFDGFRQSLQAQFVGLAEDTTEENLQARIRGTLLMAMSNKTGALVLTTGNKSEMATGYCTLYGDMAGGFAVIKDVCKTLVWKLCEWRNRMALAQQPGAPEPIPQRIITRPPSAELRPDQVDQDSLPPYEMLDAILTLVVEEDLAAAEVIALGYPEAAVQQVVRLIRINEYKRRQSPVGVRITHRGFGRDWRFPITSRYRA